MKKIILIILSTAILAGCDNLLPMERYEFYLQNLNIKSSDISPGHYTPVRNQLSTFSWPEIDGATFYDFQISTDSDFDSDDMNDFDDGIVFEEHGISATSVKLPAVINSTGEYFWRFRAYKEFRGWTGWVEQTIALLPDGEIDSFEYKDDEFSYANEWSRTSENISIQEEYAGYNSLYCATIVTSDEREEVLSLDVYSEKGAMVTFYSRSYDTRNELYFTVNDFEYDVMLYYQWNQYNFFIPAGHSTISWSTPKSNYYKNAVIQIDAISWADKDLGTSLASSLKYNPDINDATVEFYGRLAPEEIDFEFAGVDFYDGPYLRFPDDPAISSYHFYINLDVRESCQLQYEASGVDNLSSLWFYQGSNFFDMKFYSDGDYTIPLNRGQNRLLFKSYYNTDVVLFRNFTIIP